MIKESTIDKIFDAVEIEKVVGDFVKLEKKGVNFVGKCPFHNEKTPSFTVNPTGNYYHCFGCGVGGNSVKFIMEHSHKSYPEALKYLGDKFGIPIEEEKQTPEQKETTKKNTLLLTSTIWLLIIITNNYSYPKTKQHLII